MAIFGKQINMKLNIIASGSKANTYIMTASNGECIIIDQGCSYKEICTALNFDLSKVVLMLCGHFHKDHSTSTRQLMAAGIDCIISPEEYQADHIRGIDHRHLPAIHGEAIKRGDWEFLPFSVIHDTPNPMGFLIRHPECGLTLYLTDACYSPYIFPGLNNILIECNYDLEIISNRVYSGTMHPALKNRVLKNHLSLETCKQFLKENDLSEVINIVLLHLSDSNSDAARFKKEVEEQTAKTTYIATKGLLIDISLNPF